MIYKNVIGLDISDVAIKVVQIDENKAAVTYGDFSLPAGIVTDGLITDHELFVEKCTYILDHIKPVSVQGYFIKPHAIVSLPEDKVWSHTVRIPSEVSEKEYGQYITQEAAKVIPFELSELYTSFTVSKIRDAQYGTFVGAQRAVVDQYLTCLDKVALKIDFIGSNFFSVARAVLPESFGSDNYIIIDVGHRRTTIGAFDENAAPYVALQNFVSKHDIEHEKTSKSAGGTDSLGKEEAINSIVADISHVMEDFLEHTGETITKVLITGQLQDTKDFVARIGATLEVEVSIANPYSRIRNTDIFVDVTSPVSFANTIGLALYGVDRTMPHINLLPADEAAENKGRLTLAPTFMTFDLKKTIQGALAFLKKTYASKHDQTALLGTVAFLVVTLVVLGYVLSLYLI
ncbi:MAG: Tfp pilus assembly PilM family ATPase [Acidimicrobiales bacterium]|jgi:Tfp pilus assembly PilM family ATPase